MSRDALEQFQKRGEGLKPQAHTRLARVSASWIRLVMEYERADAELEAWGGMERLEVESGRGTRLRFSHVLLVLQVVEKLKRD